MPTAPKPRYARPRPGRGRPAAAPYDERAEFRAQQSDPRIGLLRDSLLQLVRGDGRDLTARQLTAFMSIYMDDPDHSISSLADLLNIDRSAVTRIIDRLLQFGLVDREEDRENRRRTIVRRTAEGWMFFRTLMSAPSLRASRLAGAA